MEAVREAARSVFGREYRLEELTPYRLVRLNEPILGEDGVEPVIVEVVETPWESRRLVSIVGSFSKTINVYAVSLAALLSYNIVDERLVSLRVVSVSEGLRVQTALQLSGFRVGSDIVVSDPLVYPPYGVPSSVSGELLEMLIGRVVRVTEDELSLCRMLAHLLSRTSGVEAVLECRGLSVCGEDLRAFALGEYGGGSCRVVDGAENIDSGLLLSILLLSIVAGDKVRKIVDVIREFSGKTSLSPLAALFALGLKRLHVILALGVV